MNYKTPEARLAFIKQTVTGFGSKSATTGNKKLKLYDKYDFTLNSKLTVNNSGYLEITYGSYMSREELIRRSEGASVELDTKGYIVSPRICRLVFKSMTDMNVSDNYPDYYEIWQNRPVMSCRNNMDDIRFIQIIENARKCQARKRK